MKNAHLRFGHLVYTKALKDTTTHFKVPLDRFIGEVSREQSKVKAHLVSVVGADSQIAALYSAIGNRESFTVESPNGKSFSIFLGEDAECYRGAISLQGWKRPVRHLVAISEELGQMAAGKTLERAILVDEAPEFVWASLAHIHGIPGTPDWAGWVFDELRRRKATEPLLGIGCNPLLIKASKGMLMSCVSRGLRKGAIGFPQVNGLVQWSRLTLCELLKPASE